MDNKLLLLIVSVLSMLASSDGMAADRSASDAMKAYGAAGNIEMTRGSGRDLPLIQALNAIVPRGYTVRTVGVSKSLLEQPVSWSGGRPWTDVVLELLDPYPELAVDVSFGARMVVMRQATGSSGERARAAMHQYAAQKAPTDYQVRPAQAEAVRSNGRGNLTTVPDNESDTDRAAGDSRGVHPAEFPYRDVPTPVAYRSASGAMAKLAPIPEREAPRLPNWDITIADQTIRSALSKWAVSAGWQLLWELPVDYPVAARASIPGQFEQAIEAVVKSLESAQVPARAVFYRGNHVVRIVVKGVE